VINATVEQEPLVKAAQAAQLARRGSRVNVMQAQMLKKGRHVLLNSLHKNRVAVLQKFGKGLQVAQICFAGERSQTFLHAQVSLMFLQQRERAIAVHTFDYERLQGPRGGARQLTEPPSTRNQIHHLIPSDCLKAREIKASRL